MSGKAERSRHSHAADNCLHTLMRTFSTTVRLVKFGWNWYRRSSAKLLRESYESLRFSCNAAHPWDQHQAAHDVASTGNTTAESTPQTARVACRVRTITPPSCVVAKQAAHRAQSACPRPRLRAELPRTCAAREAIMMSRFPWSSRSISANACAFSSASYPTAAMVARARK